MSVFKKYYYESDDLESLDEVNFLTKTKFATNLLRKIFKTGTVRIKPSDYDNTSEVGARGFFELYDKIAQNASDPKKTRQKHFIKDMKKGKFNINKEKELPQAFIDSNVDSIEDVSVFVTNKGGNIILYFLKDDDGDDRYFIAVDDKAEKYFRDRLKMSSTIFIKRSKMGGIFDNTAKGDIQKANKGKPTIITIKPEAFSSLLPASHQIEGDQLTEAKKINKPVIKVNDQWKFWVDGQSTKQLMAVTKWNTDKYDYQAVDIDGYQDDENQPELDQILGIDVSTKEPEAPAPEAEAEAEPETKNDPVKKDIFKNIKGSFKDLMNKKPKRELFNKIKGDLKSTEQVTGSNIDVGFKYVFKNGGKVWLYTNKDRDLKLAYDDKGGKMLQKRNVFEPEELMQLK